MSTVVTKLGSVAENLDIGLPGASDWTNLPQALTSDNLHATNNFNNGTGVGTSNYLYVSGFSMNLPTTAVIEGISARVERKGVGSTEDYYVGLIYNDSGELQITAPGKQLTGAWTNIDSNVVYGGSTDLWDTVWTHAMINHADFGFAIAIEGNPANLDSGSVDQVELTVTYHQVINEVPTGGLRGSGTAGVTSRDIVDITSAGVGVSGHGAMDFKEVASGGIRGAGTATVVSTYVPTGGIAGAGSATVAVRYNHTATGVIEAGTSFIVQTVLTPVIAPSGALLSNSATVSSYYGPLGGSTAGGSTNALYIFQPTCAARLRAGGSAFVDPYIATGGAGAGGTAEVYALRQPTTSGGSLCSGTALHLVQFNVLGGAGAGGTAAAARVIDIPHWDVPLTGSQVVPAVSTGASGVLEAWLNSVTNQFDYRITYSGFGSEVTGINFHFPALAGSNTSVVVALGALASPAKGQLVLSNAQKTELLSGRWYVVITTEDHPSGEIRGQLNHAGLSASGTALVKPYIEIVSGGASLGGEALVKPYWDAVSGGVKLGGRATRTAVYGSGLRSGEFDLIANYEKSALATSSPSHTQRVTAKLWLDEAANIIYWDIRHNIVGLDAVRLRGPSTRTQVGVSQIQIDTLQPTTSPIIGSAPVTAQQKANILAGLWYLQVREDQAQQFMRAQLVVESMTFGGTAIAGIWDVAEVSGGSQVAGQITERATYNVVAAACNTGAGGAAVVAVHVLVGGTGRVGGAAEVILTHNNTVSGGVRHGGAAPVTAEYSVVAEAGQAAGGMAVPGIGPFVSGGMVAGGTAPSERFVLPFISGGVMAAPAHVKQQTYAASGIGNRGGVKCGARARAEKLKNFSSIRRGQGRTLGGSNFLTVEVDRREKLKDPVGAVSPVLDEHRFRIQHDPGWCDAGEGCGGGVLAPVIKRRQKGVLPPKGGRTTTRDRGVARSNASS